jgi:heme/copper-type cytochrome/quinol oxidase subunit 2
MEPVIRETDRGEGVHHHVHQWVIIVCIVVGVALVLALFVMQQREMIDTESTISGESSSEWSYDEKLNMLSDLNARAERERSEERAGSTD